MRIGIWATLVAVILLAVMSMSKSAEARGLCTVSAGHARASVSCQYVNRFQGFVTALLRQGYRIDFMGGIRHSMIAGTGQWSRHASGAAIDINQTGRGRVTRRLPRNEAALAARFGLFSGSRFCSSDIGHYQIGAQPCRRAYARNHRWKTRLIAQR